MCALSRPHWRLPCVTSIRQRLGSTQQKQQQQQQLLLLQLQTMSRRDGSSHCMCRGKRLTVQRRPSECPKCSACYANMLPNSSRAAETFLHADSRAGRSSRRRYTVAESCSNHSLRLPCPVLLAAQAHQSTAHSLPSLIRCSLPEDERLH